MNKCKFCEDFIDKSIDTCSDCENLTDVEIKKKVEKINLEKIKSKNSKIFYYRIYNLIVIPFIFCFLFNIVTGVNKIESVKDFIPAMASGFSGLVLAYYPPKLIMLLVNRYRKKKWDWPIGYSYFVFPLLLLLILTYFKIKGYSN